MRWPALSGGPLTEDDALALLAGGDLQVKGRIVSASNTTLYAEVSDGAARAACVYKPSSGERPLWDFPRHSLAGREVAAYQVSVAGGFDVVPPTVLRDGPFGAGSAQLWVEPDDGQPEAAGLVDVIPHGRVPSGWAGVLDAYGVEGEPVVLAHALDPRLATMATFDVVANNADRKAGHVLAASGNRVVGVDHGLTFHCEPKLRTVLWGFAGRRLAPADLARVRRLAAALVESQVSQALAELIAVEELAALRRRVAALERRNAMPGPDGSRPAIPWPPF